MAILSTFGAMTARGFGWVAKLAATGAGLYAWGQGGSGQLGQGSLINYSSPVQVGTLTTWSKASAGQNFVAAVKTDGTLYAWGANGSGQLGLGDTTSRSSPVQVGALTTWSMAYPKTISMHAIKTDGTLWAWGNGIYGALGVGNTTNYSSPVQVGALTTWASANKGAFSFYQTVAIKTNGTLWAWGYGTGHDGGNSGNSFDVNVSVPVGGPPLNDQSSPVQIGAATNWARSASGNAHSLAITTSGALYAWGNHISGQCGQGAGLTNPDFYSPSPTYGDYCTPPSFAYYSNSSSAVEGFDITLTICSSDNVTWTYNSPNTSRWGYSSPVQVGALTTWSQVAAGNAFSLAVKTDGTLWGWGDNGQGQLGVGNTVQYSSPVQVGALTTWANVFAGVSHTVAIKTNGTLWAWGANSQGQLGQGNTTIRSSPVQIGTATNWLSTGFSAGGAYTMAIRS
jgi:alpha-tubulin suppressor-like RCC1 family protein